MSYKGLSAEDWGLGEKTSGVISDQLMSFRPEGEIL